MSNPEHPEHDEMKEWLGLEEDEQWNADDFDPDTTGIMIPGVLPGLR